MARQSSLLISKIIGAIDFSILWTGVTSSHQQPSTPGLVQSVPDIDVKSI